MGEWSARPMTSTVSEATDNDDEFIAVLISAKTLDAVEVHDDAIQVHERADARNWHLVVARIRALVAYVAAAVGRPSFAPSSISWFARPMRAHRYRRRYADMRGVLDSPDVIAAQQRAQQLMYRGALAAKTGDQKRLWDQAHAELYVAIGGHYEVCVPVASSMPRSACAARVPRVPRGRSSRRARTVARAGKKTSTADPDASEPPGRSAGRAEIGCYGIGGGL